METDSDVSGLEVGGVVALCFILPKVLYATVKRLSNKLQMHHCVTPCDVIAGLLFLTGVSIID